MVCLGGSIGNGHFWRTLPLLPQYHRAILAYSLSSLEFPSSVYDHLVSSVLAETFSRSMRPWVGGSIGDQRGLQASGSGLICFPLQVIACCVPLCIARVSESTHQVKLIGVRSLFGARGGRLTRCLMFQIRVKLIGFRGSALVGVRVLKIRELSRAS